VDFVIKLKNGLLCLFDTKTLDSDKNFVAKHNALYEYLVTNSTSQEPMIGGIIVPKGVGDAQIWKYCRNKISSATDTTGWVSFEPSTEKNKM
jgi:type III restriction enzyme